MGEVPYLDTIQEYREKIEIWRLLKKPSIGKKHYNKYLHRKIKSKHGVELYKLKYDQILTNLNEEYQKYQ